MSFVFVVDPERNPLDPVHPGRARFLLTAGHAAVLRRYPFTIILKETKPDADPQPLRVKLDPGSQTTGIAVVNDATSQVVWAGELDHQGDIVQQHLDQRRHCRRDRRQRHTRYRPPRFDNRRRPEGWLPPSLASRVQNILTWVQRLSRLAPIEAISLELVKFDAQLLQHAEISGMEYQQGELAGYEVREYLLEKFQRRCAYCGKTKGPFEIEHITPKARGGSDRVSNLTLACHACNELKGTKTATEFGHPEVQAQARVPLKDAAAVNTTRWVLYRRLQATGWPVETGTGGARSGIGPNGGCPRRIGWMRPAWGPAPRNDWGWRGSCRCGSRRPGGNGGRCAWWMSGAFRAPGPRGRVGSMASRPGISCGRWYQRASRKAPMSAK